jgi:hypothetical protein
MIYVNYLSGTGAINDISAGGVSAKYPTLFTPAGFTFSIWGLIYITGFLFIIKQSWMLLRDDKYRDGISISLLYSLSCLLNIFWIFTWHYDWMGLSVVLMIGLLITLIALYQKVTANDHTSLWNYLSTMTPISFYLSWICIATVANMSVWLHAAGWEGSPLSPVFWASLMIMLAACINIFILVRKRDIFFALVYLWAAYGILMARSEDLIEGSLWVSRFAVTGMIIVFLGILYARYVRIEKAR